MESRWKAQGWDRSVVLPWFQEKYEYLCLFSLSALWLSQLGLGTADFSLSTLVIANYIYIYIAWGNIYIVWFLKGYIQLKFGRVNNHGTCRKPWLYLHGLCLKFNCQSHSTILIPPWNLAFTLKMSARHNFLWEICHGLICISETKFLLPAKALYHSRLMAQHLPYSIECFPFSSEHIYLNIYKSINSFWYSSLGKWLGTDEQYPRKNCS